MPRSLIASSLAASLLLVSYSAAAQDASPPVPGPTDSPTVVPANPPTPPPPPPPSAAMEKQFPAVGGHLGMALPIATLGGRKNVAIGEDYFTIGLTPGITVHLDDSVGSDTTVGRVGSDD